ncbi:hypothetical protein KI387_028406, partial [Taxus chinensis]
AWEQGCIVKITSRVLFLNKNAGPDAGINRSLVEAWPDCAGEEILKENQFYSTLQQGIMGQCSENDFEMLKHTMLKHEEIFRDQVRELHRLYRMQKMLMAELKKKDSNTSTLTCGLVHDGPFSVHVGSESLKSEGKSGFWGTLSIPMINKDGRDCRQPISGVDYMQNQISGLFEQNLQMGLTTQEGKQSPRDLYNLQPSRARKWTFDLEQPADEYMDAEVANKNEEAKTLRRALKDDIKETGFLDDQSTAETESEVQLTLKTGCEKGGRENGRQSGACMELSIPEISRCELKEHKQFKLRHHEEALLFPTSSTRSEALTQEAVGNNMPVLSNQNFSRGPFSFDQEYKKNREWPSLSGTMLFQEQRESRYSWPKEGIFTGTIPQHKNTVFSYVSSNGLAIDPSPTSTTGSRLGVSLRVITNSHKELSPAGLWGHAEDSLCRFPRGVHSQEFRIQPETDPQMQNVDLQDNYLAHPFVTSASTAMNVKQKYPEFGMDTWYQNGNPVQHTRQESQSLYHAGSPSTFGQALCQGGPIVGLRTSQQQGAALALSSFGPSSSAFPSHSLQECSRPLWPTNFIGSIDPSNVESKMEKEVDLTLGLSSGIMEESKKGVHYSSATNKTEVSSYNNTEKFEIANKSMHQETMHLHGDVQREQCITRTFMELPYTEKTTVKHVSHENGFELSEIRNSSSQGIWYRKGHDTVSTKQLVDNLGEKSVSPTKEKISLGSDVLKVHDITNGEKGVDYDVAQTVEGGIYKSENILGFVDKRMNNSTAVWEKNANSQESRTGKNHADIHMFTTAEPAKHEMKIETFKENINAVYGPHKEVELGADSLANKHVSENFWEGTSLALGIRAEGSSMDVSSQLETEDKFGLSSCSKVGRVSASGTLVSLTEAVSVGGVDKDGESLINFSPRITISDKNNGIEINTNNALHFGQERENGSKEALCCSNLEPVEVLTKDDAKKDDQAKEMDCAEPASGTYKDNVQPSHQDRVLENCSQYMGVERSSGYNFESELDTYQINTAEDPSSSCPILECKGIGNSGSKNPSVNTDAANVLFKIASEKSSDRLDSLKFLLASGVKGSLEWFADAVVSNADILESTSIRHREEADNPLSSTRSVSKAKPSQISEDSIPKTNDCSPHASNDIDFFESMTLMLEESNVDVDCKTYATQEEESEKPPSPVNPILKPPKRGKRRRDFQREILPSISSLSRQEITEDMQIMEV